ncbi:TIR domain-containing protein [Nonomuraea sp. NPDC049419]|uniref:TIR domain-containing protein n=1 Tax=Nonomuraea sp. NPDC049419 TaxID=3155772 RepID=UPI003428B23A
MRRAMKRVASQQAGYDVFISYSHSRDTGLAEALQSELQRFACPWYRPRALRVFRDKTDMAASPRLWPEIERALSASRWFVLMASPDSAASPWVCKEVEWWQRHRSPERLLIALTDGTITWAGGDFDWARTDAIPQSLSRYFAYEPLWIDLRPLRPPPGTTGRPRLGGVVAEFAAPVHGRPKDTLVGEHIKRQRQTRRVIRQVIAALSTLATLATAAAVAAVVQRDEAVRQALIATAGRAAAESAAMAPDRMDVAQLLAVEAYRMWPDEQTRAALLSAVTASPALVRHLQAGAPVSAVGGSQDGRVVVAGTRDGRVLWWRAVDGARAGSAELPRPVKDVAADRTGRVVAATDGTSLLTTPATRLPKTWGGPVNAVALSPSGRFLAVAVPGRLTRVDLTTGARRTTRTFNRPVDVAMPSDSTIVVGDVAGKWEYYTGTNLRPTLSSRHSVMGAHGFAPTFSNNGAYFTHTRTNGGPMPLYPTIRPLTITNDSAPKEARSHGNSPQAIALSDDGLHLAVADGTAIYVSSVDLGGEQVTLPGSGAVIEGGLRFLGDRDHLVSAAGDVVTVWDLQHAGRIGERAKVRLLDSCSGCDAPRAEVSADGRRVAVQTVGELVAVHDWKGRSSHTFEAAGQLLGWSADDARLFTAQTDHLETLDMRDLTRARSPLRDELLGTPIAVTPDGRNLLLSDMGALEIRDAMTGVARARIPPPTEVTGAYRSVVDFERGIVVAQGDVGTTAYAVVYDLAEGTSRVIGSGSSQYVATGGGNVVVQRRDGPLEVWDHTGTTLRRTIPRDTTFSPRELPPQSVPAVNDTLVVQRKSDGVIVLTDLNTGTDVGTLRLPGSWAQFKTSMRLTADGSHLITATDPGGSPGLLVRWRLSPSPGPRPPAPPPAGT